jgi:transposase
LAVVHPHAAGVDIGASEIYVAVPEGGDACPVQVFPTFTTDLQRLVGWLQQCGIETVAMEATGIYWVPLYEMLLAAQITPYLVNARHLKRAPGRKSDVADCQWLQQLHTYGLLTNSFRPEAEIVALRTLVRHRESLVRYRAAHIQHMQKALEQMNLKLTQVVSDISGVTGLKIIRAMVAGEHDPHRLAQLRQVQCAKSEAEIAKALAGHYRPEHLFTLAQALAAYDFYARQIEACDAQLARLYTQLPPSPPADPPPATPPTPPKVRRQKPRKNQAHFDLATMLYQATGVDLTAVDGLDALTVQTVLSEIGTNMRHWPTAKHFASWLGLAPCNDKSGGQVLRSYLLPTKQRAARALRLAAQALSHSQSGLGAFYRRMRAKMGPAKANTATAHKLARIIYAMLRDRTAYQDPGVDYYDNLDRERAVRLLTRKAARLGLLLVPSDKQRAPLVS